MSRPAISQAQLEEAHRLVTQNSPFRAEPGDYAELADENEPDGIVHLRRKNGVVFMSMPRDVWEELRHWKEGKPSDDDTQPIVMSMAVEYPEGSAIVAEDMPLVFEPLVPVSIDKKGGAS